MDLENIIIMIITFIVCGILFTMAQLSANKKNKKMLLDNFEIKYPPYIIGMCLFFTVFTIGFSIWLYPYIVKDSDPFVVYPIFIGIALIFLTIAVVYSQYKVTVHNDTILIKTFLKKERSYNFSDITKVANTLDKLNGEIKVYVGKKKIFNFSKIMTGYNLMCKKLNILEF